MKTDPNIIKLLAGLIVAGMWFANDYFKWGDAGLLFLLSNTVSYIVGAGTALLQPSQTPPQGPTT